MNIKDYLHLYLGGIMRVDIVEPDGFSWNTHRAAIRPYSLGEIERGVYKNPKPILRPLSDMTEEECSNVYTISRDKILHEHTNDFHVIKNKNGFIIHRLDWLNEPLMFGFNGQIYSVVEDGNNKHIELVRNHHGITIFLLSKHFDLFGLIDAGLAIDKTKIKML